MSRAEQLPLMMSLADGVAVQQERDRAEACAQAHYDRAEALAAENDDLKARLLQVKTALQAEQARNLELQRELILAQTLARMWEVEVQICRRDRTQAPRPALDKDTLLDLVKLCHPDRWQHQPAETLAHEISIVLNDLRSRRLGVV